MGSDAEVRVLGPVEVLGPGGQVPLAGTRQRALVAMLALDAGVPVGQARLVDALWGEDPPRTAVKTLHSHVARVRQALADSGLPDLLVTRGAGYALALPRTGVDAHRFDDRVAAARHRLAAGDHAAATAGFRAALALWRGDPLADAAPAGWAADEAARLLEARLAATEDLWETELALGRHAAAVGDLDRLLVGRPGRERLVGLYMLALYRSGRHADALGAYQRLRAHLADELGVDPGPDLQGRYTAILRRDPALDPARPVPTGPAQLPAAVGHFTGRAEALAALDGLVAGPERRIAVLSGPAGVGKTALAVDWAHRVAARFDAGQLFLDLRGHDPDTALAPGEALGHLLRGLGVAGERIPTDLSDLTGLYRSLTHARPILVVVDNAADVDQVLPLVPATAAGFLLVTSRQRLVALGTHHAAAFVGLDVLSAAEGLALLRRVLGPDRVGAEPGAAAELVRLCDGLPLALRIAGAKLAADPGQSIGRLAADLGTGDRLDELSVPGDSRSVRTVFASAYRALSPGAARLLRHLGTHPGPTFDAHLASALTGPDARPCLAELAAAHLIVPVGDRYRFHDLIRLYAAECARRDEPDIDPARLLDWYLAVAHAANQVIGRARDRVTPTLRHPPATLPFGDGHAEILGYLDGEHANMTPVVRHAVEHGHDTAAWQLTYLLTGFFEYRGQWSDRVELCRLGLAAAERLGDASAAGLMYSTLGVACVELRRFDDALGHLRETLVRMRAVGDHRGQGVALNNMAVAYLGLRRFAEAAEVAGEALAGHRAHGHTVGVALALNNLGYAHAELGDTDRALAHLAEALEIGRELGNARLEAGVLNSIGQAHLYADDLPAALDRFGEALAARRRIGDRRNEAETLNLLALTHLRLDQPDAALVHLHAAEEISCDVGDEHFEAVIRNNLGAARLRTGDLAGAERDLHRALALRTRIPDPHEEAAIRANLAELAARVSSPRP
ncbi:SARP family transcriptional regulator [Longispora fulva]|uniref:DNA-binding SARP family transcriptional activator/Tfp pilus assembly protein PilF n=1 Tax=Longispora fulva TaxID=619741 RepID=A0A8J7KK78_9ACTN|nr:BTAD domain-containing putative transcriptional regulator [Longispora fulva]MBG6137749.1 DNA-binding SARP family transcriptional activator/Tfp pilus assembly protein PilF [Longispora fulva]GIG62094.1 SARP family transcriptional regulator [Longispora fulva]